MKKKSAAVVVVALGVLPFYACSNSEQAAYMERPSIEANALEAEQAEQEFAELAAKEAAGEETHVQGKLEKKVAKNETPKAEKRKPAHEQGHKPEAAPKAVAKAPKHEAPAKVVVAKHETPKHETVKHEAPKHETAKAETHVTRKVASVSQTGSTSSVWVVQLGAFRVKENAEKLTAKLKTNGYPVMMRAMNHSKNGELFVVSLEPTPNKSEAQKWQQELKTKSFDTNLVFRKD